MRRKMRTARFFHAIQLDLRLFVFVLLLLAVFRAAFMFLFAGYLGAGTRAGEILFANFIGLRLSMKTAGYVAAVSFVFATLPVLVLPRVARALERVRRAVGAAAVLAFTVLFLARFPFYATFRTTYNLQVVAGMHDDGWAILSMLVQEYGLIWRLALALVLAAALAYILRRFLALPTRPLPRALRSPLRFVPAFLLAFSAFFLFVRFGGAFTYSAGINWENAGRTSDDFLNECILDDGQALYRTYAMYRDLQAGEIPGVEQARVREFARAAAGHGDLSGDDLAPYLARTAAGARLETPRHIFLILGESWAQWPMMERYADLHVADGIKALAASPHGYASRAMLPNGEFTSVALTGIITGLSDVARSINYEPRSLQEVYPTALAPQMKRLGYKVDFWYGGLPSWDGIKRLALAQGFDDFYGYPDFDAPKQNAWGTTDKELFQALAAHLADEPPTVHVVMTVSNHPPYNIDLAREGLDLEALKAAVRQMPGVADPDTLAVELGHYWYMDKVVTDFVRETAQRYPDALFILTGDHAVRTNPGSHPTAYEEQSVPFVLYGTGGVNQSLLPKDVAGGLTNIAPTLIELIAPKGFSYTSIVPPLTQAIPPMGTGFNRSTWITEKAIGRVDSEAAEALPWAPGASFDAAAERERAWHWIRIARTLSWYLVENGTQLPPAGK